jgi:hypothetical protein
MQEQRVIIKEKRRTDFSFSSRNYERTKEGGEQAADHHTDRLSRQGNMRPAAEQLVYLPRDSLATQNLRKPVLLSRHAAEGTFETDCLMSDKRRQSVKKIVWRIPI